MKCLLLCFIFSVLNVLPSVFAKSDLPACSNQQVQEEIKTGKEISCITSKGFVFQMENGFMHDLSPEGKRWEIFYKSKMDHYKATAYCQAKGMILPSGYPVEYNGQYGFPNINSDFVIAENHGIREVFLDMKAKWFWSSSLDPDPVYIDYAYDFSGNYGGVYSDYRRAENDSESARCVAIE